MLEVLRKIVQEVSSEPDLDGVLDLIVRRIQSTMNTDVCSVYMLDAKRDRYYLRASQGLNANAIGQASLARNQGLIGHVGERAEPINLDDAPNHPKYMYLPVTGEERYNAFLGVPIIHQRDVFGVLVVQHAEKRRFDEGEEAFLVTLSAQLAGVIAHAEATGSISRHSERTLVDVEKRFDGLPGSPGVALGVRMRVSGARRRSLWYLLQGCVSQSKTDASIYCEASLP